MKVIFVTNESFLDHSYTIVKELSKHIELNVYFLAKERNAEINEWLEKLGGIFVKRKRYRSITSFFSEFRFIRSLKREAADNIWFDGISIYQIIFAKLFLKKFLVTVHDVESHPESKDKHAKMAMKLLYLIAKKNIAVASNTQAELFKKLHGVYPKVFLLPIIDYYTDAGVKSGAANNGAQIKFFFFGSIEPYKGIETLLEAVAILEKENKSFQLNIYGKLKYNYSEIENRIKDLKSVSLINEFIDYKQIHKLYSENNVLVLPYKQVTQCGPMLISYCEGKPVICSNLAGFREYMDDGKSGYLFNNSAEQLAEKMMSIINNPGLIKDMSSYLKNTLYNKFSMEALAETYIKNLSE